MTAILRNATEAVTIIIIPGKPFAKQRARTTKFGTYTPKETVSFERTVGIIAAQHFPTPLPGPVRLDITAVFEPPPSWSAKKRSAALTRPHAPHMQKPDADNIAKAICDGMNRVAFADDAQIFEMTVRKVWGHDARTIIRVEEV